LPKSSAITLPFLEWPPVLWLSLMRCRGISFHCCKVMKYQLCILQYQLSIFNYFCKKVFWWKISKPIGFVCCINGCDDGDLIQEDINFQDIATTSCTTNDIIFKLKEKKHCFLRYLEVLCKWTFTNWCTNHDRHQQQQSLFTALQWYRINQ
jgi:hypothetical protein